MLRQLLLSDCAGITGLLLAKLPFFGGRGTPPLSFTIIKLVNFNIRQVLDLVCPINRCRKKFISETRPLQQHPKTFCCST